MLPTYGRKRRIYKINWGRAITYVFSLLILICSIGILTGNSIFDLRPMEPISDQANQYTTVIIGPGDTLWSVAVSAVNGKEDIRAKVIEIRNFNQLSANQSVHPGQQIKVPLKIGFSDYRLAKQN